MSPSDQRQMASLSLQFNLPPGVDLADLRFSVYDGWENLLPGWNKRVIEDPNLAVLKLREGLYTVRWDYAGEMQERVVRLPQQQQLEISFLLQTPAPVPGAADTHEYYSYLNGTIAMNEQTGDPLGDPTRLNSRLHLLLRAHNQDSYHNEDLAEGLRLLDENLNPLFELRERSRADTWGGSLLCSLPSSSGRYFLEYRGGMAGEKQPAKLPRLFPVQLFPDWQTRLFIFYEGGQPNFASASLSLVRLNYDDSYGAEREERYRVNAAADMALSGLQNNRLALPREFERALLYGKFENPMLGLLGAHYLLRHPEASQSDPEQERRWRDLAAMVLSNLEQLLPDSPDVAALLFKASLRFGANYFPPPTQPVGRLPLLRASLEALLEADSETVTAIDSGSPLENLAANLYFDSPWATFRPLRPWGAGSTAEWVPEKELTGGFEFALSTDQPTSHGADDEWLVNSVQDVLKMTSQLKNQQVNWNRLATSLGVPYRKMLRVVRQVENQQIQPGGVNKWPVSIRGEDPTNNYLPQSIFLNGINGSTGQALDEFQLTTEQLAKVARQKRLSVEELREAKLRRGYNQRSANHMGVAQGIEIDKLAQAGWGVIFPASLPEEQVIELKESLKPLLDLRREQASQKNPNYYREFIGPELGYRAGESKNDFLRRFGRGPGAANPDSGVPFYLLIVGSPEEIPFVFQYQLDLAYGVGRIYFDELESYSIYARSVVAAEKGETTRSKNAIFFGPSHDRATGLSSSCLVSPLAEKMVVKHPDWHVRLVEPAQSTKSALSGLLGGAETPALLFTASHGLGFNLNDPRLLPQTGSLVCQDFTNYTKGPISEQYYFSADDIASDADVSGTLAFFFACFGAGSPRTDNFYRAAFDDDKIIAPYAFLARLPLKLLSHPRGGALGVYAHVDRAWGYSFLWDDAAAVADVETFRSMLSALLSGKPAGAATDYFGARYGEIAAQLNEELDSTTDEHQDEFKIAWWWTANHDARNYTFIGDPAVRLAVKR